MRKYILLAVACLLCVAGCATTGDLDDVRTDLRYLNSKIDTPNENVRLLKEENAGIRSDIKKTEEALSAVRNRQADIGADITGLRESIRQLTGQIEAFRKDFDVIQNRDNRRDEEMKAFKAKLDEVSLKIDHIGKQEETPEMGDKGTKQAPKETAKREMDEKGAYEAAYDEFKAGRYEKARKAFQEFLKQYPKTEYSDNAQFRIGECYYFEKNYEKAVLEYDKVVKNYPDGDRVPYALLKQGLSFINLGDKTSARIFLQRVVKDYPNTNMSRIAQAKLLEIK